MLAETKFWWQSGYAIPVAIPTVQLLGFRLWNIYRRAKTAPKRSPGVRRIEIIVVITLWSIIAVAIVIALLMLR